MCIVKDTVKRRLKSATPKPIYTLQATRYKLHVTGYKQLIPNIPPLPVLNLFQDLGKGGEIENQLIRSNASYFNP